MLTREVNERPYARAAFLNPYNLSLLFGGVVLGLAIDHPWISVMTTATEAMWMIFAPDSRLLRALWFDRAFEAEERLALADDREKKTTELSPADRNRLGALCSQKQIIARLAKDNPSLGVALLTSELAKLDALLDDFIGLGVTAGRAERHCASFDFSAMRRSWHMYEGLLKASAVGDPRRQVAERNLEVLRQRRARFDDLGRTIQIARGQMELIEQTFRLLADEILSLGSPRELGERIEELRVAVATARELEEVEDPVEDERSMVS